jgi:pyridoxamine 5'-phosphate oxidase
VASGAPNGDNRGNNAQKTVVCSNFPRNDMSIEQMRRNYAMAGLHEEDVDSDPLVQFGLWFQQAQQPDLPDWVEINAMTLSTVAQDGAVSSRIVLLKGVESGKLCFFTNYDSTKGQQMAANPQVALCFFWPHLERQVRIEGTVSKTDREQSDRYFQGRPRGSQLGAHVSQQSSPIENRTVLEERLAELEAQYADQPVPCPNNWGGYEVTPTRFEFWQGRPNRLHDRICYQRVADRWHVTRLAP